MRPEYRKRLQVLFTPKEMAELEEFIDQEGGFSPAGELTLISAFLELQEYKPFSFVMERCREEWPVSWSKQDPSVRGNPGAEGITGGRNRVALETLYNFCEIYSPFPGFPLSIPAVPFIVVTRNEVYQFGPSDSEGWREVARSGDPLFFKRCRIHFFAGEKPMHLEYLDIHRCVWHSAVVVNVKFD